MFTGIIEETGEVISLQKTGKSVRLKVRAQKILERTKIGDSIAVNGVCLTAVALEKNSFTADISEETAHRSGIMEFKTGKKVNLERALTAQSRLGGHIVQGHVDGRGIIKKIAPTGTAILFTIEIPGALREFIAEKGSVAIDGMSLTVASVSGNEFSVSIIPHTMNFTTLKTAKSGDKVNIECDVTAKYLKSLLESELKTDHAQNKTEKQNSKITYEFLQRCGF